MNLTRAQNVCMNIIFKLRTAPKNPKIKQSY